MKNLLPVLLLSCTLAACGDMSKSSAEAENQQDTTQMTESSDTKYALMAFEPSVEFPGATIEKVTFEDGVFDFKISGGGYELGVQTPDAPQKMCANSKKGQHIHLIIDDQPYAAKYKPTFEYEIEDGDHYMLAFLSRSYHESIKTDAAHVAQKVNVKNNSFSSSKAIEQPMLFYSRPKGTYIGDDTEKVMLDFYLVNATLGTDYMVKVDINGQETHTVDTWQPYYITGLPMGDNRITLTLVDAQGNAVDTPLNPVERVFTLKEDPAPEM